MKGDALSLGHAISPEELAEGRDWKAGECFLRAPRHYHYGCNATNCDGRWLRPDFAPANSRHRAVRNAGRTSNHWRHQRRATPVDMAYACSLPRRLA